MRGVSGRDGLKDVVKESRRWRFGRQELDGLAGERAPGRVRVGHRLRRRTQKKREMVGLVRKWVASEVGSTVVRVAPLQPNPLRCSAESGAKLRAIQATILPARGCLGSSYIGALVLAGGGTTGSATLEGAARFIAVIVSK